MTEKEILLANRQNLRLIDQITIRENENLTNISSEMPCVVHLNNMQHLGIEQMNEFGTSLLRLSHDELISLGENFVKNYLHPEDVKLEIPNLIRFYGNADLDESYTFCQRVYDTKKRDYYWMLTTTKICRTEDLLISTSLPFNQVNHLTKKVNLALNDNVFMRKNWEKFASLSKREREVFNLIATGKSNTEIGELLFVSRETIKRHRKNIYYKLEINSIAGVLRYARAFVL